MDSDPQEGGSVPTPPTEPCKGELIPAVRRPADPAVGEYPVQVQRTVQPSYRPNRGLRGRIGWLVGLGLGLIVASVWSLRSFIYSATPVAPVEDEWQLSSDEALDPFTALDAAELTGSREDRHLRVLLDRARLAEAAGRMDAADAGSAPSLYAEILRRYPDSGLARRGFAGMEQRLIARVELARRDGDFARADETLRLLETLVEQVGTPATKSVRVQTLRREVDADEEVSRQAADTATEVARLLAAAESAWSESPTLAQAERLLETYRQALDLQPGEPRAQAGLDRLLDLYLERAEQALATGQLDAAEGFLEDAGRIRAESAALADLRNRLAVTRRAPM